MAADALVGVARRTLGRLGPGARRCCARVCSRWSASSTAGRDAWAWAAAEDAVGIARDLGDPATLALALNAQFLQSFQRPGAGPERDRTGAELVALGGGPRPPDLRDPRPPRPDAGGGGRGPVPRRRRPRRRGRGRRGRLRVTRGPDAHRLVPGDARRRDRPARRRGARVPRRRRPARRGAHARCARRAAPARAPHRAHAARATARRDRGRRPWPVRPVGGAAARARRRRPRRRRAARARARPSRPPTTCASCCGRCARRPPCGSATAPAGQARRALARTPDELAGAGSGLVSLGPVRGWLDRLDGRRAS